MKLAALLKSKVFIGVTAAVIAASAVVTGLVLKNRPDEYRVIKVHDVKGTTSVTRSSVGELEPYTGMNLESGDEISTRKESTLRMVMDSTKYVLMEPETNIELTAAGTATDSKTRILLRSGSVLNEIIEPLALGASYEIAAPKATMAVRGTSFRVTVEKDEYGDYVITLYVFHGNVSVQLLDENGNPSGDPVLAPEDKKIIIRTVRNEHSGNDPSVDGKSFFVMPDENGELVPVPPDKSPLLPIDYFELPREILQQLYDDDNEDSIKLYAIVHDKVVAALFGAGEELSETENKPEDVTEEDSETSTVTTTSTKAETVSSIPETKPPTESSRETKRTSATTVTTTVTTKITSTTAPQVKPDSESSSVTTTVSTATTSIPVTLTSSPKEAGAVKSPSDTPSTTEKTTSASTETSETSESVSETTPPDSKKYTVLFYDYDGKPISEQVIEEGGSAEAPTDFTSSYTDSDGRTMIFDKWSTDFTNVRMDLTVRPLYEAFYSVKFLNEQGSIIGEPQTVREGESAVAPEDGYSTSIAEGDEVKFFVGWDTDFSEVTSDLSVKPVYKPGSTLNLEDMVDGELSSYESYAIGDKVTLPKPGTVSDGYKVGWFAANSDNYATQLKPVTAAIIDEDSELNCYVLTRYKEFTFSGTNKGEKFSVTGTVFCTHFYNELYIYYLLFEENPEPIELRNPGYWYMTEPPKICGVPVTAWLFSTAEETDIDFTTLLSYIYDNEINNPEEIILIKGATYNDGVIG